MKRMVVPAALAWSLAVSAATDDPATIDAAQEVAPQSAGQEGHGERGEREGHSEDEQQETKGNGLDVADILANPLADEDYKALRNCIWGRDIDDIEVLDDALVVFRGRRREVWLNQLNPRCLGLTAEMLVNLQSYAGAVCRLDKFHGVPRFGSMMPLTAECRLGSFETIDEVQVEALRQAIKDAARP